MCNYLCTHACECVCDRARDLHVRLACANRVCELHVRSACAKCVCEVRVRSACVKCACDFMKNISYFVSARSCNLALPGSPPSVRRLASSLPPHLPSVCPFVGHRLRQHPKRWPPTPRGTMGRKKGKAWRKAGKNREGSRKNERRGKEEKRKNGEEVRKERNEDGDCEKRALFILFVRILFVKVIMF